jgi:hypothetical protein
VLLNLYILRPAFQELPTSSSVRHWRAGRQTTLQKPFSNIGGVKKYRAVKISREIFTLIMSENRNTKPKYNGKAKYEG